MTAELFPPSSDYRAKTHMSSFDEYKKMYDRSVADPEGFWSEIASELHWDQKWTQTLEHNFDIKKGPVSIKWFADGKTNICYNAVDRIAKETPNATALIFEPNDPKEESKTMTYAELQKQVSKFANVLRSKGVSKGDCVAIYMPMTLEIVIAMLACARIGAIHSVVFGGFSAEAFANRVLDSRPKVVVTADGCYRGSKFIGLKAITDEMIEIAAHGGHTVETVIVFMNRGHKVNMKDGRDFDWSDLMKDAAEECPVEWVDAEHPLFMLYTSGSTGKPKGALHTHGGYMVYTYTTSKYTFDLHKGDVFWCTADCGWVTGHSYITYGPLLNGVACVVFEGIPNFPDCGRFWEVVDKHLVTQFYTAPTAIRALMRAGDEPVTRSSRKSVRVLGTVGEPINPEAWRWYYNVVGEKRCPIVDTWWQTETGGHMIVPLPGAVDAKPGSASFPFFGVVPVVLDDQGQEITGAGSGVLCIKKPWPGQMRTVFGDHKRFEDTYYSSFPGYYFTGDGCNRDEDGYYWITGRVDDIMNVSGHRLGTAEVESALVLHKSVAEAAVVGYPHDIKGEGIFAYVILKDGVEVPDTAALMSSLKQEVRKEIGPIATPDVILLASGLPKTRSGKIMRRILRKVAAKETDNLGDISTLAEPGIVKELIDARAKL